MGVAILLIDWENLKTAFVDKSYNLSPEVVAERLRTAASQNARPGGFHLEEAIAVAPITSFDRHTMRALETNKITPYSIPEGQDTNVTIAVLAMHLYYRSPQARFFVIVTGDADHTVLANELNKGESQCQIWALDQRAYDLRSYPNVISLIQLLDVRPSSARDIFLVTPEGLALAAAVTVFSKAFLEALGQRAGEAAANLPRRVADLVKTRRREIDGTQEMLVGVEKAAAATIVVTADLSDDARLALLELDVASEELRGRLLRWDTDASAWHPCGSPSSR